MKFITTFAAIFSLTLLIACGGGGGGSTASSGSDRVATPIETRSIGNQIITIGGEDGVVPLSGLDRFTPSIISPTMQTFRDFSEEDEDAEHYVRGTSGTMGRIGICCTEEYDSGALPGDPERHTHYAKSGEPSKITESGEWEYVGLPPPRDLSGIHPAAVSCQLHACGEEGEPEDYFVDSSYRSRTSSTATVGGVSFARGSLTATRRHDNTPLEFQTFAGWLGSGFFKTTQISIGESGREQYRLYSHYLHHSDHCCSLEPAPSGTGSAIWEGAAVASIKDAAAIEDDWSFIRGDATIDIDDLANPDVDLRFDNWHLINGRAVSLPAVIFDGAELGRGNYYHESCHPDCTGKITTGGFILQESKRYVVGSFHGANQRGVGGAFETEMLQGAFGAVRQE